MINNKVELTFDILLYVSMSYMGLGLLVCFLFGYCSSPPLLPCVIKMFSSIPF